MAHNQNTKQADEWQWLSKLDVDIENFHIKNASICGEYLLIFARGQPAGVYEQCCSFLLVLRLIQANGQVTGVEPEYKYFKLDPIIYAQFAATPFFSRNNDNTIIRVLQEDNYSENFPRQLIEITVQKSDFNQRKSLVNTYDMRLIDIDFPIETAQ